MAETTHNFLFADSGGKLPPVKLPEHGVILSPIATRPPVGDDVHVLFVSAADPGGVAEPLDMWVDGAGGLRVWDGSTWSGGYTPPEPEQRWPDVSIGVSIDLWGSSPSYPASATYVLLHQAHTDDTGLLHIEGYTGAGKPALISSLTAARQAGKKVLLQLGRGGYGVNLSNTSAQSGAFQSIVTDLGGQIDGVGFAITSTAQPTTQQYLDFVTALKTVYGADFNVVMNPGGGAISAHWTVAKALHDAGHLDEVSQLFFDTALTLTDVKNRVDASVTLGIPASKIGTGQQLGATPSYWDMARVNSWVPDLETTKGVTRGVLWLGADASQKTAWADAMAGHLD